MESVLLLGVCAAAWLAWLPAVLAEKEARGEKPSTSIMPIIPFFPLVAWLAGLGLNALQASLGTYLVGGLHVVLLIVFLGSTLRSAIRIRAKRRGTR